MKSHHATHESNIIMTDEAVEVLASSGSCCFSNDDLYSYFTFPTMSEENAATSTSSLPQTTATTAPSSHSIEHPSTATFTTTTTTSTTTAPTSEADNNERMDRWLLDLQDSRVRALHVNGGSSDPLLRLSPFQCQLLSQLWHGHSSTTKRRSSFFRTSYFSDSTPRWTGLQHLTLQQLRLDQQACRWLSWMICHEDSQLQTLEFLECTFDEHCQLILVHQNDGFPSTPPAAYFKHSHQNQYYHRTGLYSLAWIDCRGIRPDQIQLPSSLQALQWADMDFSHCVFADFFVSSRLQCLDLQSCQLTVHQAQALVQFLSQHAVQQLVLSDNPEMGITLQREQPPLLDHNNNDHQHETTAIQQLDLGFCQLDRVPTFLQWGFPLLHTLSLSHCPLGGVHHDDEVGAFTTLSWPHLQSLDLSFCHLDDADLQAWKQHRGLVLRSSATRLIIDMPALEKLSLAGNDDLTETGLVDLPSQVLTSTSSTHPWRQWKHLDLRHIPLSAAVLQGWIDGLKHNFQFQNVLVDHHFALQELHYQLDFWLAMNRYGLRQSLVDDSWSHLLERAAQVIGPSAVFYLLRSNPDWYRHSSIDSE